MLKNFKEKERNVTRQVRKEFTGVVRAVKMGQDLDRERGSGRGRRQSTQGESMELTGTDGSREGVTGGTEQRVEQESETQDTVGEEVEWKWSWNQKAESLRCQANDFSLISLFV